MSKVQLKPMAVSSITCSDPSEVSSHQTWDFLAPALRDRGYEPERFSIESHQLNHLFATLRVSEEKTARRINAAVFTVDVMDSSGSTTECLAIRVRNYATGSLGVYDGEDVASERDCHLFELPRAEAPSYFRVKYPTVPDTRAVFGCREFLNLYQLIDDGSVKVLGNACYLPPKIRMSKDEAAANILSIIDDKFRTNYY